jgi:bacterioferritin
LPEPRRRRRGFFHRRGSGGRSTKPSAPPQRPASAGANEKESEMKGQPKVIEALNGLLADELTAINQYMVHSEMCDNWGYARLHEFNEKRAIDEMKHAEKLIGRILFLDGIPLVSKLNQISIGADVPKQLANDRAAEDMAIKNYNAAIKLCVELADNGTREFLDDILEDEERHIDDLEAHLDQVAQVGVPIYLGEQIKKS